MRKTVFILFIVLGCFLYLLNFTWLKWGDLIIDIGREMHVPLVLSEGKLLYADIVYIYGPFTPYLHALLFKIFGPHLNCLIFSGILTTVLVTIFIYKISRVFLDRPTACLTTSTFLFVFAFGQYVYLANYNFILPYSYSAIHGILFSLIGLYLLIRFIFTQKKKYLFWHSLFIALSLLCRIEIGFSAWIAFICAFIIYNLAKGRESKISWGSVCLVLCLPVAIFVLAHSPFLLKAGSWAILKNNFLHMIFSNLNKSNLFVANLSGFNEAKQNLLVIGEACLVYLSVAAVLALGSFLLYPVQGFSRIFKSRYSILTLPTATLLIAITLILSKRYFQYPLQYRCLPFIIIFFIAFYLFKLFIFKKRKNIEEDVCLLALCFFSIALLLRIILKVRAAHYGFYLLVPGMMLYYIFFLSFVPRFLRFRKPIFQGLFMVLFALLIVNHFGVSRFIYSQKTLKVESDRGSLYFVNTDRTKRCKELIDFLTENTNQEDKLVVFPEGTVINFLAQRENPLAYYHFLPQDFAREQVQEEIIRQFEENKVDYIAIVQRSTAEYGYPVFGVHYAQRLLGWIKDNYRLIKLFGPMPFSSQEFGIALLKHR